MLRHEQGRAEGGIARLAKRLLHLALDVRRAVEQAQLGVGVVGASEDRTLRLRGSGDSLYMNTKL